MHADLAATNGITQMQMHLKTKPLIQIAGLIMLMIGLTIALAA